MIRRLLAEMLDRAFNTAWPMEAQHRAYLAAAHLSDLEAGQDVFEPDELWAAAHLKQPADAALPNSPEVGASPAHASAGPQPAKGKPRAVAATLGSNRKGSPAVQPITRDLTKRGWLSLDISQVRNVVVSNKREMGIIQARIDQSCLSLPLSDWTSLFSAVNQATEGQLLSSFGTARTS